MAGLWFEEFSEGMVFDHPLTRTVTETDNLWFSNLTLNPQPLHIDFNWAAENSEFGQPLVNSLFTLGLLIGISVGDTTLGTTVANLGMTDVNFPKPMFHGDSLRVKTTVKAIRESKSRPENGIVVFLHEGFNQHGEKTAECTRSALMKRRPAEA